MPNQYTKVQLFIEDTINFNEAELSKLLTITTIDIYKEKLPKDKEFISLLIKDIKEEL